MENWSSFWGQVPDGRGRGQLGSFTVPRRRTLANSVLEERNSSCKRGLKPLLCQMLTAAIIIWLRLWGKGGDSHHVALDPELYPSPPPPALSHQPMVFVLGLFGWRGSVGGEEKGKGGVGGVLRN